MSKKSYLYYMSCIYKCLRLLSVKQLDVNTTFKTYKQYQIKKTESARQEKIRVNSAFICIYVRCKSQLIIIQNILLLKSEKHI